MHYHKEYVDYFTAIAVNNKQIADTGDGKKFVVVEMSADPFKKYDLQEYLKKLRSDINYPALVLVTYDGEYNQNTAHAKFKYLDGGFFVFDQVKSTDDRNVIWDKTERICEEIISYMQKDFEDNIHLKNFELQDFKHFKVSEGGRVGTRIDFRIMSRSNPQLKYDPAKWNTPL